MIKKNNNSQKKIRLSKSVVGQAEARAISRVIIEDGYLGMGKEVQIFETELQSFFQTKRSVICVNSGTAALHLAVESCVPPGSEVLVQSLTYIASFQAIAAARTKPVPCEINPETCTIDLKDAQKRITDKTRAIMPVHYAGRVGQLDEVYELAEKYHLRVIEDAAHAFGTVYKNKKVGSFGDIVCFSFDGIKNITSGEGGAIITSDRKVAKYAQDARLLGVEKDTEKRYQGQRSWEFEVVHQGYRYHMSNLLAAIGRVQLERFKKEFKIKRQKLAKRYHEALRTIDNIILFTDEYDKIVPHIFPIRVLNNKRDKLRQDLINNNIECAVHYYPNHLLVYFGAEKGMLPITEQIYSQLLTLPLHPDLTEKDQDRVINKIRNFFV